VCCGANRLLRLCLVPTGICFASFVWEGAGGGGGGGGGMVVFVSGDATCHWMREALLVSAADV